nr:enoyl-CoA hydratase-related protein [Sphingomonas sp. CDS-1]
MISVNVSRDGVCEIVIDNPPVNAFSIALLKRLALEAEKAGANPEVKCVLLRASGRGFSAGGDVKEVEALEGFEGILGQAEWSLKASLALIDCPVPVIGAVQGYCIGVGVLIAASADILIAAKHTRFVLAEVDNGATTGAVHALKLMPEKRARAAMMMAEPIYAEELHGYGSVLRTVPLSEFENEAWSVAAVIARKPRAAMTRLKESFNNSSKAQDLRQLYRAELAYTLELNMMGLASEGRKGFIDRRRDGY